MIVVPFPRPRAEYPLNNSAHLSEVLQAIDSLALYLSQNGPEQEGVIRQTEQYNPKYKFLLEITGEVYQYYRWQLYCACSRLSPYDIESLSRDYCNQLRAAPEGTVGLIEADKDLLFHLLEENTGNKEILRDITTFILNRAHSMTTIANSILDHVVYCDRENKGFQSILHDIYVINEVLFSSDNISSNGIYFNVYNDGYRYPNLNVFNFFSPFLTKIFHVAYNYSNDYINQNKVLKILDLWKMKGIIKESQQMLFESMIKQSSCRVPPEPTVIDPLTVITAIVAPSPVSTNKNEEDISSSSSFQVPSIGIISSSNQGNFMSLTVGEMADVCRESLAAGHPKYTPFPIVITRIVPSNQSSEHQIQSALQEFNQSLQVIRQEYQ